jgi:HEAT repeat protein
MGFLNEDIEAYVHKFMHTAQKPEQAVQMLNFLKLHPGVWGIAHIPINLELLSWLWSKGKLTLERGEIITLSKLYQTIIDQVQKAYIRKTSKRPIARDLDDQMESKREDRKVSTVADRVNEFLEHLAYNAMETETLFISATQIKIALEKTLIQHGHASNEYHQEQLLKSATDKLGFLRAVGQCDESQLAQDHYFIHLSFQEFYAAKYITRILSERPHAEEGDQVFQSILTEKYTPRYQLVLWMSAGLLYQQGKKSQQFSSLLRFWRAILSQPRDMIGFHHNILILHCLDECEADDRLALHKALITQQCKWFEFYGKQNWDNSYTEQFACCSILIASSSMMTYLLQVSQNGDDKLRSAAIKILGRLRNPSEAVIRVLLAASWDKDWGVRYVADLALVRINNSSEAVIEILLSGGLRDENEITRYGAAFVLGKLNSPSETVIEILLRALRNKNEYFRGVAARVLGEINGLSEAVIEDLLIALRDEDKDVKRAAASALAKINNPSEVVIKALLSALRDKDECVSHAFIKALGNLNNPSTAVIEALLSDLRDKEYARPAVVSALCNLNNPSQAVIEVLLSAFQDENVYVKRAAVEALGKLKNSNVTVIEALLRALQDKSGLVSHPAVEALGKLNNPNEAVIKALINVLQNKEWIVRNATVSALGNLNNPSQAVIEALLSALQDENDVVRYDAAGALGNLNNPSQAVIEALLSALQDESELVRYGAVEALGNLNNPSEVVIDALLSALQDEGALSSATALDNLSNANTAVIRESLSDARDENWDPKIAATEALGKLNNPSKAIIKALLSALQDKNLNVRDAAVQALSTPKTIQATILIFKQLIKDEQRSFKYFSCWFKENYLLLIDHKKGKIVARRGRQNYTISLSPNDLLRLEKQILFIADQQNYLPEFYNLPGRNSNHTEQAILQRCEPDASICFVSDAMWLVHLVRKKISQRTLLIVEGITVEKDIMQCYEFTLSLRSSNPRSGFFLPGSGIGCVLKTKNFLNLLEKDKKDYQCKTWDIDPATGQRLLRLLEAEASSSKMQRNDCFTWAEEKLTAIGLPVEGHWTDFNVILPAVVAEKAKIAEPYNVRRNSEAEQPILVTVRENSKAEKSIRVAEESRGCRLM